MKKGRDRTRISSAERLQHDILRYDAMGVHRLGAPGAEDALDWIAAELEAAGLEVTTQDFSVDRQYDFDRGTLMITEQGSKKRAALFAVRGSINHLDPGGVEPLEVDEAQFARALASAPHTLKRALCEPKQFSGIGNAWSDEILWHARLSPFLRATELAGERLTALVESTRAVLGAARDRHVAAARASFPDKVTAFQPEMAVHGRFKEPCPRCGARIERITRATGHDFHYCPGCQTGGKVLADRALSKLLKDSWPPADP